MILYRIRDWNEHFENSRTKEIVSLNWVPIPNRLDGAAFTELLDHPNGESHYAIWVLAVLVASRCNPRGTLIRSTGVPHSFDSLSRMMRAKTRTIEAAFKRLLEIRWIEKVHADAHGNPLPCDGNQLSLSRMEWNEGNGMEEFCTEPPKAAASVPPSPVVMVFPTVGKVQEWGLTEAKVAEYRESYPAVDLQLELKAALQWCRDNPRNQKTPGGMSRFLSSWLKRAQNSARPVGGNQPKATGNDLAANILKNLGGKR